MTDIVELLRKTRRTICATECSHWDCRASWAMVQAADVIDRQRAEIERLRDAYTENAVRRGDFTIPGDVTGLT